MPKSNGDNNEADNKAIIRNAIQVKGFIEYRRMGGYLHKAVSVIPLLEAMLAKAPDQAWPLAEYTLGLGFSAYTRIDDSGGTFGDILRTLSAIHLKACVANGSLTKPQQKKLAKALFKFEIKDDWGIVNFEDYSEQLADTGLQQFKQLAEQQWQQLCEKPAKEAEYQEGSFILTRLMERIAAFDGDIEALVAIKKRDLNYPYSYLKIAEVYQQAGQHDQALHWAEQGIKKFPDFQDSRLYDFLIKEHQRQQQPEQAIQLAWQLFTDQPDVSHYKTLKATADAAGVWQAQRKKAMQWLSEEYLPIIISDRKRPRSWPNRYPGHGLLVEILLWEGEIQSALDHARQGGCAHHLWLELAQACEQTLPEEAINIYQKRIPDIIRQCRNHKYHDAIRVIKRLKKLMEENRQQSQWNNYMDQLKEENKRRTNFVRDLEALA